MSFIFRHWITVCAAAVWTAGPQYARPAQMPVVVSTNYNVRVMAANISSGDYQRYEVPGKNILRGLKPDVVAIQEFNYASTNGLGTNTPDAFREMLDACFGTNFVYSRESGTGYSIPNGVISRWPILSSGTWDDPQVPDRGFAWARIDLPHVTNDLYVVSVHLHSSGGSSSRNIEAGVIKSNINAAFPANSWIVVAGDLNTDTRTEAAVTTFKTFLSDSPIPTDAASGGNPNTSEPRSKPYDYVLPSFSFRTNQVSVVIGSQTFPNGLVFDSAVFSPLSAVAPVQSGDSHVTGMQHMAVVKDFRIAGLTTNLLEVAAPVLSLASNQWIRWTGNSSLVYRVESSTNLVSPANWLSAGTVSSATTNFSFVITNSGTGSRFYRVTYP